MIADAGQTIDEELALEEELAIDDAKRSLLPFTTYTKPDFEVNWHHHRICTAITHLHYKKTARQLLHAFGYVDAQIEKMLLRPHPVTELYAGLTHPDAIDRPLRNLMVDICARHGKSELISRRTPAWWLGRNPNVRIIAAACAAELSQSMNRDVQRIIDDNPYREVFPRTRLYGKNIRSTSQGSYIRNSDMFEIVEFQGAYKNAGVGGNIIGRGADLLLLDDLFRSRADAQSPTVRNGVWSWYESDAYSRLERDAAQILINQRWHLDDASGRLRANARADGGAEQWFCLVFPALLDCEPGPGDPRKQGEALWPSKKSADDLLRIKANTTAAAWESMWQQRPTVMGGGIIKDSWWRYYTTRPSTFDKVVIAADLTFADRGDFCSYQVWARKGAQFYLLHQVHGRMVFTEQCRVLEALHQQFPQAREILVEAAANGLAALDTLKHKVPGLLPQKPEGSKTARLESVAHLIEAGNVYLPDPALDAGTKELVAEVGAHPSGAHDDRMDAMVYALRRLDKRRDFSAMPLPWSTTRDASWM